MSIITIARILGALLLLYGVSLLPPLLLALWTSDGAAGAFMLALLTVVAVGAALWLPTRGAGADLRLREGFIVVVGFWVAIGLFGALPFLLSAQVSLSFTDAAFEAFSGLTTTGATVMTGLDRLPVSILYYRQQLQWLGGMGIIVLAVAILPLLGVGGMQLYRAEIPSAGGTSKLTPRITETAKSLWYLYLVLTVSCFSCYWAAGMSPFDAIAHSFSTVSIGGFSTHDVSMSYYPGSAVRVVACVFMLLSAVNFALHFTAIQSHSLRPYRNDPEFRALVLLHLGVLVLCLIYLSQADALDGLDTWVDAAFQAISIATTTGFTVSQYAHWPQFVLLLLLYASFVGASAGSLGGGLKTVRGFLMLRQGVREIKRLVHPSAVIAIKAGGRAVPNDVVNAIWGFFGAYITMFGIFLLLLVATGLDQVTAFSAVAACMNNLGPGLGEVSQNYAGLSAMAKWTLVAAMLFGRLEIFTILALLMPTFWKK